MPTVLNYSPEHDILNEFFDRKAELKIYLNWSSGLMRDGLLKMLISQVGWTVIDQVMVEGRQADVCISEGVDDTLMREHRGMTWVVCASFKTQMEVQSTIKKGAKGCISMASDSSELLRAIQQVSAGHTYLCHKLSRMMCLPLEINASSKGKQRITVREQEVLKLIAQGRTSKEIGKSLAMSPNTVESHRRNIKQKTGCHKVAELAVLAVQLEALNK